MSEISSDTLEAFYVVAREPGAENPAIPTWATAINNPAQLDAVAPDNIQRKDFESVPGAFQLLNVASVKECQNLIEISELVGYQQDAAVSLPRSVRHNDSFTWVVDRITNALLWQRCTEAVNQNPEISEHRKALGLNARYRFYRYGPGDYFSPHTDGSWPGRVLCVDTTAKQWYQRRVLRTIGPPYRNDKDSRI